MKVIVTGGRSFAIRRRTEMAIIMRALNKAHDEHPITYLAEGGATGADTMAWLWRLANGIDGKTFDADWDRHGGAAGPIRNALMLFEVEPDLVVAFPGGTGTAGMIKLARNNAVRVLEIGR